MVRMKAKIGFVCLFLPLLCLLSCAGDPFAASREAVRAELLSELNQVRYSEVEIDFGDDQALSPVAPYQEEDGSISIVLQEETYIDHDFSTGSLRLSNSIVTINADGEIVHESHIPLSEKESTVAGVLSEDSFVFVASSWGKGHSSSFVRYDRTTETITETVSLKEIGLPAGMVPLDMAVDRDGFIYLIDDTGNIIFSADSEYHDQIVYKSKEKCLSLFTDREGYVYVISSNGSNISVCKADRSTGQLNKVMSFEAQTGTNAAVCCAGEYLYVPLSDGIYRISFYDRESLLEKILDYTSSGILTQMSVNGSSRFAAAVNDHTFLFSESNTDSYGIRRRQPAVYRKVSDSADESFTVVQVAYSFKLPESMLTSFVLFNKTHDDVHVIPLDYSNQTDGEREDYGQWKMMTDIKNHLIFPDIVIDQHFLIDDRPDDSSPLKILTENGMALDLGRFMEKDPLVNRENLFGCVQKAFSDSDGHMWGITPWFGIRMWQTKAEYLNGYAADGHWTVAECLSWIDQLPPDTDPCVWFTVDDLGNWLLSDLGSFYDLNTGKCDFDSPEFVQYLDLLSSLPDEKEYIQTSPYAKMNNAALADYYESGALCLYPTFLYDYTSIIQSNHLYGPEKTVYVDFPSHMKSGAYIESDLIFMITKDSSIPDASWDYVRYYFADSNISNLIALDQRLTLPSLKSSFDEQTAYYSSCSIRKYEDGGISVYGDSDMEDRSEMKYVEITLDLNTVSLVRKYLDDEGMPILEKTPDSIKEIVMEELSALRKGHGDAKECAQKIQSRVSIWVSEHR